MSEIGELARVTQLAEWGSDRNFPAPRSGAPKGTAEGWANLGSDPNDPDPDSAGQPHTASSRLWQRIQSSGIATLAVMGMTKNTGKTVTLNHLLVQAAAAQVAVGVTSIGRDCEDRDAVFFVPKPPIRVWPGNLVATARATLQRAKVRFKLIAQTK